MEFETIKPFTEEEKEKTLSRMKSDAELMEVGDDGKLEVTSEQVRVAQREMDEEKGHYLEKANINGIEFSVGWDRGYEEYTIYFPEMELGEEMRENGLSDQVLRISEDQEMAKKVFDFVKQEAQSEKDVYKLCKKTEDFIYNLREESEK